MLQRIQSLYLALVAIASILVFFFPLANYYHEIEGNYRLFIYGIRSMDPEPKVVFNTFFTFPLMVMAVISFVLSILTIFLFKKRLLQIRLCAFNVLTNILLLMMIFFFYATRIRDMVHIEPAYNLTGMAIPLVSLVFLLLANRAIRKDEQLVKSSDRLR
jgi:hypothetical protein